jgi:hypothetical protein
MIERCDLLIFLYVQTICYGNQNTEDIGGRWGGMGRKEREEEKEGGTRAGGGRKGRRRGKRGGGREEKREEGSMMGQNNPLPRVVKECSHRVAMRLAQDRLWAPIISMGGKILQLLTLQYFTSQEPVKPQATFCYFDLKSSYYSLKNLRMYSLHVQYLKRPFRHTTVDLPEYDTIRAY